MIKENELCLAFVKYVFRAFSTSAQFPTESDFFFQTFISNYFEMSKYRNDVPNSVKILKVNPATRKMIKSVAV